MTTAKHLLCGTGTIFGIILYTFSGQQSHYSEHEPYWLMGIPRHREMQGTLSPRKILR